MPSSVQDSGGRSSGSELRRLNLYEVLQISPTATPEVIQAAYRALARTYHPDVNGSAEAASLMRQVNAAYAILSDPTKRARYDSMRLRHRRERRPTSASANVMRPTRSGAPRTSSVGSRPTVAPPGAVRLVAPVLHSGPPRIGRLLAAVVFVCLVIAALWFALWLVLGALEDEPGVAISSSDDYATVAARSSFGLPFDIISSAQAHRDGPAPMPVPVGHGG